MSSASITANGSSLTKFSLNKLHHPILLLLSVLCKKFCQDFESLESLLDNQIYFLFLTFLQVQKNNRNNFL